MDNLPKQHTAPMAEVVADCTACGTCSVRCSFLKEHGTPAEIADKVRSLPPEEWPDPFHCSLCGLCRAACPVGVQPDKLFLHMRREKMASGTVDLKPYKPILFYEKVGDSSLFSYFNLPSGGNTVLFPGCAMPSTRPATVKRLFKALQSEIPALGVALGCCMKPSHDLGREDHFKAHFGAVHDRLVQAGVERVITSCPNCQKIFKKYGASVEAVTATQVLAESGYEPSKQDGPPTVVHDPCPQRYDRETQQAVRTLAERCGMELEKMVTQGMATRCCGEGGMVGFVRQDLVQAWVGQREQVAKGRRVVTSCAGCVSHLGKNMEVVHILDEMFQSAPPFKLKPPLTYAARLSLKWWFKRTL